MSRLISAIIIGFAIIVGMTHITFWTHNVCPKCTAESVRQVELIDLSQKELKCIN